LLSAVPARTKNRAQGILARVPLGDRGGSAPRAPDSGPPADQSPVWRLYVRLPGPDSVCQWEARHGLEYTCPQAEVEKCPIMPMDHDSRSHCGSVAPLHWSVPTSLPRLVRRRRRSTGTQTTFAYCAPFPGTRIESSPSRSVPTVVCWLREAGITMYACGRSPPVAYCGVLTPETWWRSAPIAPRWFRGRRRANRVELATVEFSFGTSAVADFSGVLSPRTEAGPLHIVPLGALHLGDLREHMFGTRLAGRC
jgi:hypothetical protein